MSFLRRYRNLFKHHGSRNKLYIVIVIIATVVLFKFRSLTGDKYTGSKYNVYTKIFGDEILPETSQKEVYYFAQNVKLNFTVEDNLASGQKLGEGGYYIASISLVNTGNDVIPASKWQMYGYFMRLVEAESYPYPEGFYVHSCGLKLYLVEGCLYRFEPVGGRFKGLKPEETLTCKIKLQAFQVARTDTMPRWYVTGENVAPVVIANTNDESLSFVTDFTEERQYKKRVDDTDHPYGPTGRYKIHNSGRKESRIAFKIIPTPLEMTINEYLEMEFNTNRWVILKSEVFKDEVKNFAEGMQIKLVRSKPTRRYIQVVKTPVIIFVDNKPVQHPEAYTIDLDPKTESIIIQASGNKGVFYAMQTLSSILFASEANTNVGISIRLPAIKVKDGPRYSYRGLHLDVARNFIEVDQVLKIIDVLAMYKMNKLHLHLSDDEGWRLEIKGIPELTQIGGSRCHDLKEEQCILPMLGSGPYSNTSGSGFYTVGDYREILSYAKKRHVDVIPEFDMPGHSRAAIKSVHSLPQQILRKEKKKDVYSIQDDNDVSEFRSGQHFSQNVLNPCMPSTYVFVKKILREVRLMHEDIQPLRFYHFGGDEVAEGAWDNSPQCRELMMSREDIRSQYDLMKYFVKNITKMAAQEGMSVGAWEDAMLSHDLDDVGIPFPLEEFHNKDVYVYIWKRPQEKRTPHRAKLFANKGYKVILAYGSFLYFDHPYEPDPEERGLYWATRKLSTKDAWRFTPKIMFQDSELPCPPSVKNDDLCYKLLKPGNVMGVQAELWTETVRTGEQVEYMLFPRLLAVAERAWHKAPWEDMDGKEANKASVADWSNFVNVLGYHELPRLDKAGVKYRISPPGAVIVKKNVWFSSEFPGQDIEYYDTRSEEWKLVLHNMPINNVMKVRARSSDGKRYSRIIEIDPNKKDSYLSSSVTMVTSSFIVSVLHVFISLFVFKHLMIL